VERLGSPEERGEDATEEHWDALTQSTTQGDDYATGYYCVCTCTLGKDVTGGARLSGRERAPNAFSLIDPWGSPSLGGWYWWCVC
jgi:hypothetical protein